MAVQMRLELDPYAETLSGRVTLDGEPPRGFTGWIGFNAAIDALLEVASQQEGDRCEETG